MNSIEKALEVGEKESSKFRDLSIIPGFTTNKIRHFLNYLCEGDNTVYFEIGCLNGATLQAASYKNTGKFYGVDNFSEFGGSEEQLKKNFENCPDCNIYFFNDDCFSSKFLMNIGTILIMKEKRINVYFYDGNHSFESQKKVLNKYHRLLADEFVYIVDDWNWEPVRKGTEEGIKNYKIVFEKQIFTKGNCSPDWWNGLGVFVLGK